MLWLTLPTLLSLAIWIYLLGFRGQFWQTIPRIEAIPFSSTPSYSDPYPSVCVVIPARNEAELLPITLRSLLSQEYPGQLSFVLVDDHSTDGTATVAEEMAQMCNHPHRHLTILAAQPLPSGWTGKLWALEQGIQHVVQQSSLPDYILLTDADIDHDRQNLARLVNWARSRNLDLASLMVRLRCESQWEQLLIPAFVFFFQKLYPFRWVNLPHRPTAAAAGGCILLRPVALERIGGISAIRDALIDDCALAHAVKWSPTPNFPSVPHPIWIGLSTHTRSLRPYPTLQSIWDMVARTAYTQLHYSPWLLIGTVIGMTMVYLVPVISLIVAIVMQQWPGAIASGLTLGLMAIAYFPSIHFYQCPPVLAFCLPFIALLYTLMTLDSARRYWLGLRGSWKGRTYSAKS